MLAIELLTAARAVDMRDGEPAKGTAAAIAALREVAEGPGTDRYLSPEIEAVVELVVNGAVVNAVENKVGALR